MSLGSKQRTQRKPARATAQWKQLLRSSASWSDYEDLRPERAQPLLWLQPETPPKALLLTQKEAVFRRLAPALAKRSVAVCVVPYPTPTLLSREAIGRASRALRAPLFYFGDLDPIGLMAFAVLRSALGWSARPARELKISYLGIDDEWLSRCRREQTRAGSRSLDSQMLPMGKHERQHFDFVANALPDLEQLVGKSAFNLLASGKKLEVEGLMTLSPRMLDATPRLLASRMMRHR